MALPVDPINFFSDYIRLTGMAHIGPETSGDERLIGKRLGLLNGSSWITAWSNYFGRLYLPGVHLVNIGNEAVQINFMQAHAAHLPCPPEANIAAFVRYGVDLVELAQVDAVLITCSTMNRGFGAVRKALSAYSVPVFQIDLPMMERAVAMGGKILVIATHGPTVSSTQALLDETALQHGLNVDHEGLTLEDAWEYLEKGDVHGHNQVLAEAIRSHHTGQYSAVILAQLSMSAFLFSYPDPLHEFGLPVLTSGQCGFERVRDYFLFDQ